MRRAGFDLLRRAAAATLGILLALPPAIMAQDVAIQPQRPNAFVLWRPYLAPVVPPARFHNSGRLKDLVRAGVLYLTTQDAIALALENNIDIEIARYDPISLEWRLERAQAGGALPGVPNSAAQAGTVASGQGVAGSQAAAGVNISGGAVNGGNAGNANISQIGPVVQTYDPSFQETTTFSHTSTPEPNSLLSVAQVLISNTRVFTANLQQGFQTGGSVTVNYSDHYLNENAPTDVLNPSVAPSAAISFQHNLLRGFGIQLNTRTINAAKINLQTSDLNFKSQVVSTVVNVLNAYYTLVADLEDSRAKRQASDVARRFLEITRRQVELGALAPLDAVTAESQYATSQKDAVLSETSQQQDELNLKLLLSRNGLSDPLLAEAHIVPVDRIEVPEKDEIGPLPQLLQKALANRSDLAAEKEAIRVSEVNAIGTRNGVLPLLLALGAESHAGLAGVPRIVPGQPRANDYFIGGIGTGLGQVFRRDFPTERIGAYMQAPIRNRQAQADEAIDQLQLRQQQLMTAKDFNQLQVDLQNAAVALQQARARFDAALRNEKLQQQLLDAEQRKFALETSTPYNVIQQQRDLVNSGSSVLAARVAYSRARISLDETLGTTLDTYGISLNEVKAGKISRQSKPVSPQQ